MANGDRPQLFQSGSVPICRADLSDAAGETRAAAVRSSRAGSNTSDSASSARADATNSRGACGQSVINRDRSGWHRAMNRARIASSYHSAPDNAGGRGWRINYFRIGTRALGVGSARGATTISVIRPCSSGAARILRRWNYRWLGANGYSPDSGCDDEGWRRNLDCSDSLFQRGLV